MANAPAVGDRGPGGLAATLRQFGITPDAPGLAALGALLAERLALGEAVIRQTRRSAARHPDKPVAAAVAARAVAAGRDPESPALCRLADGLASGPDQPGGAAGLWDNAARASGDGFGAGQDWSEVAQDTAGRGLAAALAGLLAGLAERAAADPELAALARPGPDGRGWLCVPFQVGNEPQRIWGHLRVYVDYRRGAVERLAAEMHAGGQVRWLELGGRGRTLNLAYAAADPGEAKRLEAMLGGAVCIDAQPFSVYHSGYGDGNKRVDSSI